MHCSCAMTTLRVTPPADEKGADVEGAEEVGGAAVSIYDHFGRSWASLRLTIAAFMAHMTEKMRRRGIRDKKMAKYPRDSQRKNEIITGRYIPIDIYEGKLIESLSRKDSKNRT